MIQTDVFCYSGIISTLFEANKHNHRLWWFSLTKEKFAENFGELIILPIKVWIFPFPQSRFGPS